MRRGLLAAFGSNGPDARTIVAQSEPTADVCTASTYVIVKGWDVSQPLGIREQTGTSGELLRTLEPRFSQLGGDAIQN